MQQPNVQEQGLHKETLPEKINLKIGSQTGVS